jgi:hypothetical protein
MFPVGFRSATSCREIYPPPVPRAVAIVLAACAACTHAALPKFPPEVSAALVDHPMRRLETEHLIIYYPAARAEQARRFADHAERCAETLIGYATVENRVTVEKMIVVMPETAFNNAYVAPPVAGVEDAAVIPTFNTLDFATEFGLPPDPKLVGCHELVHYVHVRQIDGLWRTTTVVFGDVASPQIGFDPWFFEGIATHYEATLQPGVGRPRWPIFTGMFAAAYAGGRAGDGDLSAEIRRSPIGNHYLVGAMFVRFLTERYGERALWIAIGAQATSQLVISGVKGRIESAFGTSWDELTSEFARWTAKNFPVRQRPAAQARIAALGNDARYARGRDGTEAWIADDVDAPARLVIRDRDGTVVDRIALVDLVPPRKLAIAAPLLVSGLSITDAGDVWFTAVDLAGTSMTTRLLRWRRGDGLDVVASGLGPGATIAPDGSAYFHADVDGDRWRLARYDLATRRQTVITDVPPGSFVLGAQPSPDGARLVASAWDGTRFVLWIVDARTGARLGEIARDGPVYDGAFLGDGRVVYLGAVDGRFQAIVRNADGSDTIASDVPYAALAPRAVGDRIRLLSREGWQWMLDEIAVPPPPVPVPTPLSIEVFVRIAGAGPQPSHPQSQPQPQPQLQPSPQPQRRPSSAAPGADLAARPAEIVSDRPYSRFERLFIPGLRAPTMIALGPGLPLVGVVLGGGDRLGFQRWGVAGYLQLGPPDDATRASAGVGYANAMLAPWLVLVDATWYRWAEPEIVEEPPGSEPRTLFHDRRTREASFAVARTYRGALSFAAGASIIDDRERFELDPPRDVRLGGPLAAIAWSSAETTPYVGVRRGIDLFAGSAYFPARWSTFAGDLIDVAGRLTVTAPLPLGRRHTIAAAARGRAILADADTDLIEVGGQSALASLWQRSSVDVPEPMDDLRFPPGRRFVEPVRGFEDVVTRTDRVALASLTWRYPIVIDRSSAFTWFLPGSLFRQIDLDAFGTGWFDLDSDTRHAAAGGAITFRISLFRIPLAIQYQASRRITDDDAWLQLVAIGPDV